MTPARQKTSPPKLAKRWGIDSSKIIGWIRSGELRAVNLATRTTGRPRWAIDEADIELFEARRSATPPLKTARRQRRKNTSVIEFF
jgi:transposase